MLSIGLLFVVTTLVGLLNMVFDVGALSTCRSWWTGGTCPRPTAACRPATRSPASSGPAWPGLLIGLITAPITLSVDAVSYLASALG